MQVRVHVCKALIDVDGRRAAILRFELNVVARRASSPPVSPPTERTGSLTVFTQLPTWSSNQLAATPPLNPPGRWDAMISYTQRNASAKHLAAELYSSLRERGLTVWLDVKMGKLNEDAMKEAAQHSRCIIAVVTGPERDGDSEENAYFKRQYCMNELRWARVRSCSIFLPQSHLICSGC